MRGLGKAAIAAMVAASALRAYGVDDPCARVERLIGSSPLAEAPSQPAATHRVEIEDALTKCPRLTAREKSALQVKLANGKLVEAKSQPEGVALQLRSEVIHLSQDAIRNDASSVPAAVTLARALKDSGKREDAAATFENLFRTNPSESRWQHVAEYADLFPADDARPLEFYSAAVKAKSVRPEIQSAYLISAARLKPDDSLNYLWDLLRADRAVEVQKLGCEILGTAASWNDARRRELLTVIIVAFAASPPLPEDFPDTPVAQAAVATPATSPFAQPLQEIARLYDVKPPTPETFPWWTAVKPFPNPGKPDLYPSEAFRHLLLTLGSRLERQSSPTGQDLTRARDLYATAMKFQPERPSPEAATKLAQLYVTTEQAPEFVKIATDNDAFLAKYSQFYNADDWKTVFDYHCSLAHLADVLSELPKATHGDETIKRNLIEVMIAQYRGALEAATHCEPPAHLSGNAVQRYAKALEELGDGRQAAEISLNAVDYYLGHGLAEDASDVLDSLKQKNLPSDLAMRCQVLSVKVNQEPKVELH